MISFTVLFFCIILGTNIWGNTCPMGAYFKNIPFAKCKKNETQPEIEYY
jgi:hypothetical protein